LKGNYGSLRHSNGKFLRLSTNFTIWAWTILLFCSTKCLGRLNKGTLPNKLYRNVKHTKKIQIIKDSGARGTKAGVLPQGRLAIRLYPYAMGTKIKTTVSIGGHIHWMSRGLSLQHRTC
jgi:hypothetical protein